MQGRLGSCVYVWLHLYSFHIIAYISAFIDRRSVVYPPPPTVLIKNHQHPDKIDNHSIDWLIILRYWKDLHFALWTVFDCLIELPVIHCPTALPLSLFNRRERSDGYCSLYESLGVDFADSIFDFGGAELFFPPPKPDCTLFFPTSSRLLTILVVFVFSPCNFKLNSTLS